MSNTDLAVIVADALRLRAIRLAAHFKTRVLYFTDSNLASAFESIRAHEPAVVTLETHFAHTPEGRAFVDRLQQLAISGLEVHLLSFANGTWTTTAPTIAPAAPIVTSDAFIAPTNTRRVPRFPVVDALALKVDGQQTTLVDMSVMGAQVISTPQLRPSQRLKITLPDERGSLLSVTACVAWSAFELPMHAPQPYYRAGMEFTDAAVQALEEFCKRHCADEPLAERR